MRNETYLGNLLEISKEQILDKERGLGGRMVPVDKETLRDMLHEAGFKAMHRFWHIHPFLALVAEKGRIRRR